jgi:hypothetical protein
MNNWSERIEEFRKVSLQPGFLDARIQAEAKARDLIARNLGRFDKTHLTKFLTLINTERIPKDILSYELRPNETSTRFQRSFIGQNRQLIVNTLPEFNKWVSRLWQAAQPDDILGQFWRERSVKGAGVGLPTVILYLKEPARYNVWLPFLTKVLGRFNSKELDVSRTVKSYLNFNNTANQHFRSRFGLEPQEIDYLLYRIGRCEFEPQG